MRRPRATGLLLAALLLPALLALAGCGGGVRPLDYKTLDERGGPGLLSDPSGRFVVYGG